MSDATEPRVESSGVDPARDESPTPDLKRKRPKPSKILPTDRIRSEKQIELLRAYGAIANQNEAQVATNKEAATVIQMSEATTSLANGFFVENAFLSRAEGMGFRPAEAVLAFARAFQWNPETATQKLAPLIAETWFARALTPRLSFRPIEPEEALSVLADACAADKDARNQLNTLVDFMLVTGVVLKEGNLLKLGSQLPQQRATPTKEDEPPPRTGTGTAGNAPTSQGINFSLDVNISMDELKGWSADRIASLFSGIAQVVNAKGKIEGEKP